MIAEIKSERSAEDRARFLLDQVQALIKARPFVPHSVFKQGDLQTLAAFMWPLSVRVSAANDDEARLFEVAPDTQVLGACRWQADRSSQPTLVAWHGLEGSINSGYMLRTADKAFRAGFNVVRLNIRNCGDTEHLTPTIYHAGLTGDLRVVLEELITRDQLSRIVVAGFSLGGNLVLKLAGEYGENPPPEIKAVGAISPSIDLAAGRDLVNQRRNLIYQRDFLSNLKRRLQLKKRLYPDLYDITALNSVRTIEEFDDLFVAPAFGFDGVNDYYAKASSRTCIGRIRIPTLIIHAKDDPFVPFAPLMDDSIAANPFVSVVGTERGGHVAFVSANPVGEDRFWGENRLVDFFGLVTE